ncbi:hypothetical protein PMI07_002076 [Rhizobium sp. CF080]|uniref:hypothetical protein n=1 Tax=Rhizobium sp. (strain CF080) TaxID=1144310 RepID=UPI0002719B09|nr:hypothetical protein [Rhizobium sp. CF080]EUB95588.1 hypothetical protein PMI07_002076 [Rhizobium sp. CF080]
MSFFGLGWNWALTWGSFLLSVLSAGCWAYSAYIPLDAKPMMERKLNDDLADIVGPLRRQSVWNGWGAALAAVAVFLQALKQFVYG